MADIVVVDYGGGNLRSVTNALGVLGYSAEVSANPQRVASAAVVILPGVGAASAAMNELVRLNLCDALHYRAKHNLPLLGVCLGLQLLMSSTEEGGTTPCLGIVPGTVRKLPQSSKIPHTGWNQLQQCRKHPLFDGIANDAHYYFVHSYYVVPQDDTVIIGLTQYDIDFCSALVYGSIVATQFHPEKSGIFGLKLYDNFITLALGGRLC